MELAALFEKYNALEKQYWQYGKGVKHNPVRHQNTGDLFLRDFFNMAHPMLEDVAEPKRIENQDRIWNIADKATLMMFFLGEYLRKGLGDKLAKALAENKVHYPFPYIWYLICIYHDYGYKSEAVQHGTVAAQYMSERLAEAYDKYSVQAKVPEPNRDLLRIFTYMAGCLKYHSDEKEEKACDRISYKEDPFLFILSLSDVMNPLRIWQEEAVLRLIDLSYEPESEELNLKIDRGLAESDKGKQYINILKNTERSVEIKIKISYKDKKESYF